MSPVEAQVAEDEQIGGHEGPEAPIHTVNYPGLGHGLEEIVGVDAANGMSSADAQGLQGLGEKSLAGQPVPPVRLRRVFLLGRELRWEDCSLERPTFIPGRCPSGPPRRHQTPPFRPLSRKPYQGLYKRNEPSQGVWASRRYTPVSCVTPSRRVRRFYRPHRSNPPARQDNATL